MAGWGWEMEGGKELLGIVKKGLCKLKSVWFVEKRRF